MSRTSASSLERRVTDAAGEALARQKYVTAIDLCLGLRWLHARHVDAWQQGRGGFLRSYMETPPGRVAAAVECLERWAKANGLEPRDAEYFSATRDRRPLRFTAEGDPAAERAWRTHWQSAKEISRLFPGCPAERAGAIARHAALRGSGRVGRSAAGRALHENAITLAVMASVRHQDTNYDALLMSGVPRETARDRIRPAVDRVLATWTS